MFEKGDYIVYGLNGACLVENITEMDLAGSGKSRKYYILRPMTRNKGTIYCPVDNQKTVMRNIVSRVEAEKLLDGITGLPDIKIENDKLREEQYKKIMNGGDLEKCLSLIKTLIDKRRSRLAAGRKFTSVDERYLKGVSDVVNSELSLIFGDERFKIENLIQDQSAVPVD